MTCLLYDKDAYLSEFTANVTDCSPVTFNGKKAYAVQLDQTAFFPTEGGQDCDEGTINGIPVLDVSIKSSEAGSILIHILPDPIDVGTKAEGHIDFDGRYDKMQQHSGEHLVSGYVHTHFGYDNVGFHLGKEDVTLDFNGQFEAADLYEIEKAVNSAVYKNIETRISFYNEDEVKKLEYRSKKELRGTIRIVEFPGYDICACCAPHVKRTGEIGLIKIVSSEHFKGGTRMTIKCGFRALKLFDECIDDRIKLSRLLSVKPETTCQASEKCHEQLLSMKYEYIKLQKEYFSLLLQTDSVKKTLRFFSTFGDPDTVREAVNCMTAENEGFCCAFTGNDQSGYRYIIASATNDCRQLLTLLKNKLEIKGGGKPDMIQGNISSSKADIEKALNECIPVALMKKDSIQIVLASASPRRKELMKFIAKDFLILPSDKDEDMSGHDPAKMVEELSKMKALDVETKFLDQYSCDHYCIIGSDTVVAYKDMILGKPKSEEDAFNMLKSMNGDSNYVYTGVCLVIKEPCKEQIIINYHVRTGVKFMKLSDDEIWEYVKTGEPMDKAGAYAIQGLFAPYVESIDGDYYNIVGFPVSSIRHNLKQYI